VPDPCVSPPGICGGPTGNPQPWVCYPWGVRLPVDGAVLGYWGFDEANADDPALDESTVGQPLVVTASPAVVAARVGNGRQFDGVTTVAAPASSGAYQGWLRGTIICWVILDSVNQGGDLLRPIVCLDGPGVGAADQTAFALYVDSQGRIIYRYTSLAGEDVRLFTAPSLMKVNRYYSIALTIDFAPSPPDGNNGAVVKLYVNNEPTLWASATVNGGPYSDANVEAPQQAGAGANTVLTVGGSQKTASKWHGVIDELSLHNVARPLQPYLRAAYYRLTLAHTFDRLTGTGYVKTLGTAEMGGGTRWWCYERDQSIYVIRENSLGLFGAEVLLVTNSAIIPGGAEKPRLIYNAANDSLLVVFLSGGRAYRITANSEDLPATLNMPLTQDTPTIIKASDAQASVRGAGGAGLHRLNERVTDTSLGVAAVFVNYPSFGIAITDLNFPSYNVYRRLGGNAVYLGNASARAVTPLGVAYVFFSVPSRVRLAQYVIVGVDDHGSETTAFTQIVDALDLPDFIDPYTPDTLYFGRDGDGARDSTHTASGAGLHEDHRINTSTPVKIPGLDLLTVYAGGGNFQAYRFLTSTPVKVPAIDPIAAAGGGSSHAAWFANGRIRTV
jgi:hypothetical protein